MPNSPRAAVIDLGTNSIKFIIAEKSKSSSLNVLYEQTNEIRIGKGISQAQPTLEDSAIENALDAIEHLSAIANEHKVYELRLVATSAVRDALNKETLIKNCKMRTGLNLEVLSGHSEASYIAQAMYFDPDWGQSANLNLIDLGGGSLEFIQLKDTALFSADSLPLGAVRLTEQYIANPRHALPLSALKSIQKQVEDHIQSAGIHLSKDLPLLGSGGAFHILQELLGGSPVLSRTDIRTLLHLIASKTIDKRIEEHRVPERRADIFPAALQVIDTVMSTFGIEEVQASKFNLKFGILREMLDL